ncbi:hypothetical protein ACRAWG_26190 [Methylobacterium sp. P31]
MAKDVSGSRITQVQSGSDAPEVEEDGGSDRIYEVLGRLVEQIHERLKQSKSDFVNLGSSKSLFEPARLIKNASPMKCCFWSNKPIIYNFDQCRN